MKTEPVNANLIDVLRRQIGGPRDGHLLRFSLANALLEAGDAISAAAAFREALEFDRDYSAAWKLLGKTLVQLGDTAGAIDAYEHGIAAAARRGDKQAQKEMGVHLRRLVR